MISPRRHVLADAWPVLVLFAAASCREPATRIEFVSYDDPYFPETSQVGFESCYYHVDCSGDLHIACCQPPPQEEQDPARRLLYIRVFWPVRPGVTFADKTGTNAVIRYLDIRPEGLAVYGGTGFVYCQKPGSKKIAATLESGRLQLQLQRGQGAEFRDARISGKLQPHLDGPATVDLLRELELYGGPR